MRVPGRAAVAATIPAITLAVGLAVPAQAAGTGWRIVFTHHEGAAKDLPGYSAVIAPGSGDAWAFGGTNMSSPGAGVPIAAHWNGKAWQASSLPSGLKSRIDAASAPAAGNIWAVTLTGGTVLHRQHGNWSVAKKLGSGQLTGITAFSDSNVWVFGARVSAAGLGTWHFNGSTWTHVKGNASAIVTASALSARNIWAIAGSLGTEIKHYNGTGWQQVKGVPTTDGAFADILAQSRTSIWVTAFPRSGIGSGSLLHFNGRRWATTKLPWPVLPFALASDGHGGLWVTSFASSNSNNWAVHRSAGGKLTRTLLGSSRQMWGLANVPGSTAMWGVGYGFSPSKDALIWADGQTP